MFKRIIGIAILVSIIALIVVQLKLNKSTSENRIYHYDKEAPINVLAEKVSNESQTEIKSFTGTFEPFNEVKVNADIQGAIVKIYVKEGDLLKKGQSILKIDDDLLRLKLKAINTQIGGLEKDLDRYQKLADNDAIQGIKLEKTLLGLETAQTERKIIQEQIRMTTIKAPFAGIVTKQFAEVGAFAAPAMPLIELTNMSQLKFAINLTERDLNQFQNSESYIISADAFPNATLIGKLIYTSSKGNMGNNFLAEFEIENSSEIPLKSKMFGKVFTNSGAQNSNEVQIPSRCIIGSDISPKVYLVINGKAVLTPVSIANRSGDFVTISSGVAAGDIIVTGGFINLFNNANVTIETLESNK
ncbi:MAG: efflux RND transporter periplasmic adaptor subunit [Crocinitomix sp.]|nr:efflux RND transporter periplasmic adaptor subunit [Crocinitomix sp.]